MPAVLDQSVLRVTLWRERPALVPVAVLLLAAAFALLLALPGHTVTTKYLDDLFLFLDGAYRVVAGQVPSRDFHTPLGPLVHYLPAAGYLLSKNLGSAIPIGIALFILVLALPMAHVLGSRLRPTLALPFAAFLVVILAVPITLGETVTSLSFARFYNRIGWTGMAILLVMYLPPVADRRPRPWLDALSAALLLLVMAYTKATYAVVGLVFVAAMLIDPRQRRWAALALVITLAVALAVEAIWRSSQNYLSDLILTWNVSGGLRGTWAQITDHILRNLADYVLFAFFAGLSLRRTRSVADFVFYLFCAIGGFWLINQNFQTWGIITLYAGAAVAAERLMRAGEASIHQGYSRAALGAPLFLLALLLPTIIHCLIALGMHAGIAVARGGEALGLPNFDRVRLVHLWTWGEHESAVKYLAALQDGARALGDLNPRPSRVVVLDLVNPFSASLGLEPPRGDASWQRLDRTFDDNNFVPPEDLLQSARVVMEPKLTEPKDAPPAEPTLTRKALWQIYGPYIESNFDVVRETEHWRVHLRRQAL